MFLSYPITGIDSSTEAASRRQLPSQMCPVGGASERSSLGVRHWKRWHRQISSFEVTEQDLRQHETQTCVGRSQSQGRDE